MSTRAALGQSKFPTTTLKAEWDALQSDDRHHSSQRDRRDDGWLSDMSTLVSNQKWVFGRGHNPPLGLTAGVFLWAALRRGLQYAFRQWPHAQCTDVWNTRASARDPLVRQGLGTGSTKASWMNDEYPNTITNSRKYDDITGTHSPTSHGLPFGGKNALMTRGMAAVRFVKTHRTECTGYSFWRLSKVVRDPSAAVLDSFDRQVQQPRSGWDPSLDVLNLVVLVRVDNSTYLFLGNASTVNTTVNLTNVVISPTQTMLTADAGPMQINLTFLNPIEGLWMVYLDLNVGWSSRINKLGFVRPSAETVADADHFNYAILTEPESGTLHYGMKSGGNGDITANISEIPASRDLFRLNGVLGNLDQLSDTAHDFDSTVFAISRDLGTIQATQDPVISVIGYDVNLLINYTDLSGATQQRRLLYQDKYGGKGDIFADFISDFANASSRAQELDLKILQQASPISGPLGDLVSLATAQEYWWIEHKASQLYANLYAAADIGMNYPNVILANSAHNQGVERLYLSSGSCIIADQFPVRYKDSGNMLIMTYAHARASGDVGLIIRYYDTALISWANYLSNATLLVHNQSSADGLSADNQTNLAIKGIIAIEAMSKMSSIVKRDADVDKYSSTAASLYAQRKSLALTSDKHLLATYEQVGSWTLGYNLFADVWLNTSVVESPVYDGQSTYINNLSSTSNFSNSGMPVDNLDTDADNPVSSWSMFAAAMMPNQDQRTNLISRVHDRESTYPLTPFGQGELIPTILGGGPRAPVVDPPATGTSHTLSVVTSTKGVIGGVAALLAIGAIALVVWRRRRRGYRRTSAEPSFPSDVVSEVTVTPFYPTRPITTAIALHLAEPQTDSQQLLLHRPSSPDGSPLPFRRPVPIPVGLSDKELARLRSLENGPRSQPTEGPPSNPLLTVTADRGDSELRGVAGVATSSFEAQRLQLENDFLRHEIQQLELRVERSEFPPSYASDTGIAS
ncbi:hypothetical protein EDB86DRAFT_2835394 [Lactarius hatsudake]|nr:hypothetical protein EDB86DRAFT_2835394 [Lactarius hatsudake]